MPLSHQEEFFAVSFIRWMHRKRLNRKRMSYAELNCPGMSHVWLHTQFSVVFGCTSRGDHRINSATGFIGLRLSSCRWSTVFYKNVWYLYLFCFARKVYNFHLNRSLIMLKQRHIDIKNTANNVCDIPKAEASSTLTGFIDLRSSVDSNRCHLNFSVQMGLMLWFWMLSPSPLLERSRSDVASQLGNIANRLWPAEWVWSKNRQHIPSTSQTRQLVNAEYGWYFPVPVYVQRFVC